MKNKSENSGKAIKILYIEDDPDACILMRRILNKKPFRYYEAVNGLDGMRKALKEKPNLILMDIDLPDIRGDELTTKLKSMETLKDTIIIALTALNEKDAREQSLIAGCDGFIQKPVDVNEFPNQMMEFIGGKKEILKGEEREYFHGQYERSVVERLTKKVQDLELFNQRLETTSQRLREYNTTLQNVLSILSELQTVNNPDDFKRVLVDQICQHFHFERCAFLDLDPERMEIEIKYARGMTRDKWDSYKYPVTSPLLHSLFEKNPILVVRDLNKVTDSKLKSLLTSLETNQFIFAYLGTSMNDPESLSASGGSLPLFESFMPSLHDQEDLDMDIILGNLREYLANESLYRTGFIFLDNHKSNHLISSGEYRFLETLFRSASYMYQNLLLMEQLRFLFVRAEKEAITDPLTDLYNYRYFLLQLNREISRAQRHNSVFSLIMIDIDFFKNYNDTYGHQSGDLILRQIAHAMLENTRTSDIVCRYGGEEFCIICPELTKEDAKKTAEKLRQIVENLELPKIRSVEGGKLTISSGVSSFSEDGKTAYQLILNADKALYKAKENGRNRVCISGFDIP